MSDELAPLLDQARRLAVSLEGTVPEVRALAAVLDGLPGGGAANGDRAPVLDLFLPPQDAQRVEKVATGLGWKPRRREVGDGEVRDMTALPAVVWLCTPELRERLQTIEQRERPMKTLVMGQKAEPPKPAPAEGAGDGATAAPASAPADAAAAASANAGGAAPAVGVPPPPPPVAAPAAAPTPPAPGGALADPLLPVLAQLRELAAQPEQLTEWRQRQAAGRAGLALRWLDSAAARQLEAVRLRRELLQAKINPKGGGLAVRGLSVGGGGDNVAARAKPLLQRMFGELERGLGNTDGAFLGVPAGTLVRELEEQSDALDQLEMHLRANAIATRIPRSFEDQLNRHVRERLFEHFSHDLKAINDLFQLAAKEVERLVAAEGGMPIVLDPRLAKDDVITSMLDRLAVFRSTHQGELPRRGFNEYFSQIRKYAMLLMMSASMLGATAVLRSYKEITIPATLMLIGIGGFNVFAAAREERADSEQKDREAARNSVKNEMRRILNDVARQWQTVLTALLQSQQQNLLDQIGEASSRESALKTREKDEEKARLLVRAQGLVETEKRLQQARERIGKAASDMERVSRGEAPAPPAPAAPAAGARIVATPLRPGAAAAAGAKPGAAAPAARVPVAPAPGGAAPAAAAEQEPAAPKAPNPAQAAAADAKAKLDALREKMKAGMKK